MYVLPRWVGNTNFMTSDGGEQCAAGGAGEEVEADQRDMWITSETTQLKFANRKREELASSTA